MDDGEKTLSLVLFSGTDDRLAAGAMLAAGAAVMGRKVNVFLQYWALEAFREGRLRESHGVAAEAGPEGKGLVKIAMAGDKHWSETLRQAKEIGEVAIHACAHSMEMFALTADDLDPLVDDIEGIAAFMSDADGPITFI